MYLSFRLRALTSKAFIISFSLFISSVSLAQEKHLVIEQVSLSRGVATESQGETADGFSLTTTQSKLAHSLSQDLESKLIRKSEPYFISNLAAIKDMVEAEKLESQANFSLSFSAFTDSKPLDLVFNDVESFHSRDILRGTVRGIDGSQVQLVIHNNQVVGRIAFPSTHRVLVIRSTENGILGTFEVDVSDIRFD